MIGPEGSATPPPDPSMRAWVLYDGECGFCRARAAQWERRLQRRGIGLAPLQSGWVQDRVSATDQISIITHTGSIVRGPDVYRQVFRTIWWLYPVYLASCLPGFRFVFDATYRLIARNRHRLSSR